MSRHGVTSRHITSHFLFTPASYTSPCLPHPNHPEMHTHTIVTHGITTRAVPSNRQHCTCTPQCHLCIACIGLRVMHPSSIILSATSSSHSSYSMNNSTTFVYIVQYRPTMYQMPYMTYIFRGNKLRLWTRHVQPQAITCLIHNNFSDVFSA